MLLWTLLPFLAVTVIMFAITRIVLQDIKPVESFAYENIISYEDIPYVELEGNGALTIWFDDAWKSQLETAYPELAQRNLKAALSIATGLVEFEAYMDWGSVRKLGKEGWEITSHSRSHLCELSNKGFNQLNKEIEGSKIDLQSHGIVTNIYVAPCGETNKISDSLVLYHFDHQRLVEQGDNQLPVTNNYGLSVYEINRNTTPLDVLDWIVNAQQENKWVILMFHQIDYTDTQYGTTPERFREILDLIEETQIPVLLPTQVLRHSA